MKIGIISDTHDNVANLKKAIVLFNKENVELAIHCGDWVSPFMINQVKELNCRIISVLGNNEGDKIKILKINTDNEIGVEIYDVCVELELDEKKLVVFHGDPDVLLQGLLSCGKYDIVMSGHNHVAKIDKVGKTLHINPGTASGVNCKSINGTGTVAIYNTESNEANILELN